MPCRAGLVGLCMAMLRARSGGRREERGRRTRPVIEKPLKPPRARRGGRAEEVCSARAPRVWGGDEEPFILPEQEAGRNLVPGPAPSRRHFFCWG